MDLCRGYACGGGGHWAVVYQFVSTHSYTYPVYPFIMGYHAAWDAAVGYFDVLGDPTFMYKE